MKEDRPNVKQNIEIRFFLTPHDAKELLNKWRKDKWQMTFYSFVDHYFTKARTSAKIRRWRSSHTPRIETILFHRRNGVKTENTTPAKSFRAASKHLQSLGYKPYLKILKKKAWLVTKTGRPTYAFEYVPHLGWTGEIEIPLKHRQKMSDRIAELKQMGGTNLTKKSMLQLMEERLKGQRVSS